MPSDNYFNAYADGAWEILSDDPSSPWYDGPVVIDGEGLISSGFQAALARTPRGGRGGIASDPNSGDTVIIEGFHVTISADASCGGSGPESPRSPIGFSAEAGSAATLLPSGTYRATCFLQSQTLYGRGGVGGSESAAFEVVNGMSKPRLLLPYAPPSGATWSVLLTNTGGASGTERVYCNNVSSPYLDLVSDKWNCTFQAGKAVNGIVPYSSAYGGGIRPRDTSALTIGPGGLVTISGGPILTLRGELVSELPDDSTDDLILIRGSGSGLFFDVSLSQNPTQTEYGLVGTGGNIGLRA